MANIDNEKQKEEQKIEIISEGEDKLEDKIKVLKEELKICLKDKQDYLAGWQRAKADFINARKDLEKEKQEFVKFARQELLFELLFLADSFEAAFVESEFLKPENKKLTDGLSNIHQALMKILENCHISKIKAAGEKFNPAEHEALEEEEVGEQDKEGVVLKEIQSGYKMYDKVLRPARVRVGKLKATS